MDVPKKIILATDLGPRTDRALDRAFYLAGQWSSELAIVHAVEFDTYYRYAPSWKQGPNKIDVLKKRTLEYFKHENYPLPEIIIEEARPDTLVFRVAEEKGADLIVTGISSTLPLGNSTPGSTVGALVRKSACPVLTVKKRLPQRAYRHIVVGVDMSPASEKALFYALKVFPDAQKMTAIHALDVPYRSLADSPDRYANNLRNETFTKYEGYLSGLLPDRKIDLVVDEGHVGQLMASYVDDMDVDLVVAGTRGENRFFEKWLGTSATDVLEAVSCDVLIVR